MKKKGDKSFLTEQCHNLTMKKSIVEMQSIQEAAPLSPWGIMK